MMPVLRSRRRRGHDILFWEFAHGRAVRQGNLKLVRADNQPWELYDIESYPAELHDLAEKFPSKVAELKALWDHWYASATKKPAKKNKKK